MDDIEARLIEMKFYTNMFSSLQRICTSKCISKYSDSDLSVGESVCAERCTEKWVETFKKVQTKLQPGSGAPAGNTAVPAELPKQEQPVKKGWF
ncbi:mitochondrial import inner membrane translocase subunit 10 [Heterostelium album PN500]|uniref:Mitochondrial import inner membrane translocase subunit n=1 Tax=Heterostelium pallidum (strain ATCC 26659 / Pp 5 / PN500) TaxID=670386 RepID=D3BKA6_HETP5|nr:mitochondrial import inner membrane translocase subunit 10 [Heterostelium album PN500]EFA78336.1 mitochondrial import inner membrane translocase subunit 10 [Heterostelium album PN500]|eukprot:XP_020430461.1 mitochondrial import inner membrane translocase subunit 10 [Heterostelium album PN500]